MINNLTVLKAKDYIIVMAILISSSCTKFSGQEIYPVSSINMGFFGLMPSYDIGIEGDYAFVPGNKGVKIANISNPENPVIVSYFESENCMAILIENDTAYISSGNKLKMVDVVNKVSPKIFGEITFNTGIDKVKKLDNYLYICTHKGLEVYDIKNITKPTHVKSFFNSYIRTIELYEDVAYVSELHNSVHIFNIQDPSNPILLSEIDHSNGVRDIFIKDNLMFLASYGAGIRILDLSDINNPVHLGRISLKDSRDESRAVYFENKYVYAANNYGLIVYEIGDEYQETEIDEIDRFDNCHEIEVRDDYIFLSHGKGLNILKFIKE